MGRFSDRPYHFWGVADFEAAPPQLHPKWLLRHCPARDPHQHQGPPRHGAALYLCKGNDVAPSPHQATNHQQAALAEFMGRLGRLKGTKSQSYFPLGLGNQRSSQAQHPMQAQHPGDSSGVHNGILHPQIAPGAGGATRAVLELAWKGDMEHAGPQGDAWFLSSQSPLQSLQKDAVPSVQIIRSPRGN